MSGADSKKTVLCIVINPKGETIEADTAINPKGLLDRSSSLRHSCGGIMIFRKVTDAVAVLCCPLCYQRVEFAFVGSFGCDHATTLAELGEYIVYQASLRGSTRF